MQLTNKYTHQLTDQPTNPPTKQPVNIEEVLSVHMILW